MVTAVAMPKQWVCSSYVLNWTSHSK